MKHSKPSWLYGGILLLLLQTGAVSAAPSFPGGRFFEIPFEYKNHFILVHLTFQQTLPLTFIFDTGAETTLLTSVEIASLLGLTYEREIQIVGADLDKELHAFLVRNVHLQLGSLSMPQQSILVLEEDVFHFNEYTGIEVHGILGASFFRQFIVEIDYESQVIRLIPPDDFRPYKNVEALPLEIHRSKPYLNTLVKPPNGPEISVKLLVDTGAGLAMLLHPNTHPNLEIPQKVIPGNIGMGLGGNLEGVMGLIPRLQMGEYQLREIPTHFQEIHGIMDSLFLNNRNGILGNKVLERYTVTIDYFRGKMYLQPNRLFKKEFPIDKSGMFVIASGPGLNTFMVHAVLEGSPAQKAGILPGDILVSMNLTSFRFFDLDAIYRLLSRREGKKICLKIDRKGEKFRVEFRLQHLL
ncbi:MAG: aspartyl protease family protein [Saprospirales bacterium]|nr:aspartyl protease family protein [Saprospirales bacterium]MBK8491163.1 aspartyl protease family protein [Saprospirales bacterium]